MGGSGGDGTAPAAAPAGGQPRDFNYRDRQLTVVNTGKHQQHTESLRRGFVVPRVFDTISERDIKLWGNHTVTLRHKLAEREDLFFDESQYWSWSRDLAFGYIYKPPLLAWIIGAARAG
jgi:hypothetical protein